MTYTVMLGTMNPREVKAFALQKQGADEYAETLDRAEAAGWFDVELYDSAEEAAAHRAAGFPE